MLSKLYIVFCLCLGLLGAVSSPQAVHAQAPGTSPTPPLQSGTGIIRGVLTNGTARAARPTKGHMVTLSRVSAAGETIDERQTSSDAEGRFVFSNLPTNASDTYSASTQYAGVTYYANTLQLNAGQTTQAAAIQIYETSGDNGSVSVASASMVVPQVDAETGQIFILEMFSVQNSSDRTYIGTGMGNAATTTPDMAARGGTTLRFFLPSGATGITPAAGIADGDIIETGDGIEITSPVLPGANQIAFSYRLAYQGDSFTLTKRFAFATPLFRLFTPVGGPQAKSAQLTSGQAMTMGQQQLQPLIGQNVQAESQINVTLTGLPLPANQDGRATRDMFLKIGMVLALLTGLIVLFTVSRRTRRATAYSTTPVPGLSEAEQVQERQRLVTALARLDNTFTHGSYPAGEYRRKRALWKAQLRAIWPGADSPETEDAPLE